jgi:3-oxoacyl-[acyl-carrier protein] reductase
MDLELKRKRAFVSGASSGLGKATALELAKEGCDVVVHGRDKARTDETAGEVAALGVRVAATYGEMSSLEECDKIASDALAAFSAIDICVNNCGAVLQMENPEWSDIPWDEWMRSYAVNFMSGMRMGQRFVAGMKAQKWGRIINITSTAGEQIDGVYPDYAAPKAAVNNFTGNVSRALGPHGITVNAVIPGATLTPAVERWMAQLKIDLNWGDDFAENERKVSQTINIQSVPRLGKPREIAAAVCYLASPLAGYINGTSIRVDGGAAHYF